MLPSLLNFLVNVGLAWCFCVGVFAVGRWGYGLLERATNAVANFVIRPPPGEE